MVLPNPQKRAQLIRRSTELIRQSRAAVAGAAVIIRQSREVRELARVRRLERANTARTPLRLSH